MGNILRNPLIIINYLFQPFIVIRYANDRRREISLGTAAIGLVGSRILIGN